MKGCINNQVLGEGVDKKYIYCCIVQGGPGEIRQGGPHKKMHGRGPAKKKHIWGANIWGWFGKIYPFAPIPNQTRVNKTQGLLYVFYRHDFC